MGKGWPPAEKGVRHDAAGQAVWNSDEVIVVMKRANKIAESVAESVERRASAERNLGIHAMAGTQSLAELDIGNLRRMGNMVREAQLARTQARWIGSVGRRHPSQFSVFDSMQEPDASIAHVRICAGGAG